MNTNRVDGIIENVLFPGEGEDLPKSQSRFKWTPPGEKSPVKPSTPGSAGSLPPEAIPGDEEEEMGTASAPPELPDDRTGNVSINQLLGGSRFANKGDLDSAIMRMRGKLGPAGAEKWGHDYGKMEFEALARKLVDALLVD